MLNKNVRIVKLSSHVLDFGYLQVVLSRLLLPQTTTTYLSVGNPLFEIENFTTLRIQRSRSGLEMSDLVPCGTYLHRTCPP